MTYPRLATNNPNYLDVVLKPGQVLVCSDCKSDVSFTIQKVETQRLDPPGPVTLRINRRNLDANWHFYVARKEDPRGTIPPNPTKPAA